MGGYLYLSDGMGVESDRVWFPAYEEARSEAHKMAARLSCRLSFVEAAG